MLMFSIYHFFKNLVDNKQEFIAIQKLEDFPFDINLLSCKNSGVFPDLAIKINKNRSNFTGGELIELKDSISYSVSSFNSTIPSRSKNIDKLIVGNNSIIKHQMEQAGDVVFSLPIRDVYYLVRGRKNGKTKICLVYGSFFETIKVGELISQSFSQVLDERLKESGEEITDEFKKILVSIFSEQENFSRVRTVNKASVKLRFRILTEVKAEGNILNSKQYPEIKDNTLNLVLSCHNIDEELANLEKLKKVFTDSMLSNFNIFKLKHHFNGYFLVIQTSL